MSQSFAHRRCHERRDNAQRTALHSNDHIRAEHGQLAWDSVHYHWMAVEHIDLLERLLKARGIAGTCSDEITGSRYLVPFQQRKARLVIHVSRKDDETHSWLAVMADDFLRDATS